MRNTQAIDAESARKYGEDAFNKGRSLQWAKEMSETYGYRKGWYMQGFYEAKRNHEMAAEMIRTAGGIA